MHRFIFLSVVVVSVLIVCYLPTASFASGFYNNDLGPRAAVFGSGFTAVADDETAIMYNPAGIFQLDGKRMFFAPVFHFRDAEFQIDVDPDNKVVLDNERKFCGVAAVTCDTGLHNLTLGIAAYDSFNQNRQFSTKDPLRLYSSNSVFDMNALTDWKISAYTATAAGSYEIFQDQLYVGAGLNIMKVIGEWRREHVDSRKYAIEPDDDFFLVEADDIAYGCTLGALWFPNYGVNKEKKKLRFGLSYISEVPVEMQGTASKTKTNNPSYILYRFPMVLNFAAAYKISETVDINAGVGWTKWSALNSFTMDFANEGVASPDGYFDIRRFNKDQKITLEYDDAFSISIGSDLKITDDWHLIGGYRFEEGPAKDEYTSLATYDPDRHGVSVGTNYVFGKFRLGLSYLHYFYDDVVTKDSLQDPQTNGIYRFSEDTVSFSVGMSF